MSIIGNWLKKLLNHHAMQYSITIRKEWRIVLDTDMEWPPVHIVNRKNDRQRNVHILWYYASKRKEEK